MKYNSIITFFAFWFISSLFVATGITFYFTYLKGWDQLPALLVILLLTLAGSLPGFLLLWLSIYLMRNARITPKKRLSRFFTQLFLVSCMYGILTGVLFYFAGLNHADRFLPTVFITITAIVLSTFITSYLLMHRIADLFSIVGAENLSTAQIFTCIISPIHKNTNMEISEQQPEPAKSANNYLLKGFITGFLILLMLIPTIFIDNLITERQNRQQEVVREVSSKWASAQTLSGPFLVVPYNYSVTNNDGKIVPAKKNIIMLPENLHVVGNVIPEERKRSIYTVLLYKSDLNFKGNFNIKIPEDIIPTNLDFKSARICFSLSDFKGIEEEMALTYNGEPVLFSPGLPVADFGKTGLSAPVKFDSSLLNVPINFELSMKLKGSSQLHFMPLSANSSYQLTSPWPSPSFDGNALPGKHSVSENGFSANWDFNQANLPFGMVMSENDITKFENPQNNQVEYDTPQNDLSFGVSLVQPADQYDQTLRCVKYAILIIGLSFAFFFIIEIMQRKPFHPVQYVLVGIALVIFYSLLLSLSEYILFDYAYLIAALATVLLISLYVKAHFKSWKTAGIFFGLLSCLYACIFILIRLVDTALIVGSIGLFVILAIVMFASRKINWYGNPGKNAYE